MNYLLYFLLILAFVLFLLYFMRAAQRPVAPSPRKKAALPGMSHCPLCGHSLEGSRLYSKLTEYPGHKQILEIRGCDYCYKQGHVYERKCPRCKNMLGVDDVVVAAYDNSQAVTKVHIQGCRNCYKR